AACTALARLLSLPPPPPPPPVAQLGRIAASGDDNATAAAAEVPFSALSRFRLALQGCKLVARRGYVHDGMAQIALRLAGEAFHEAAAAAAATVGGGGSTRRNAVATALSNVALPVLRLYGKAGVAAAKAAGGGGLDSGSDALIYDHPLLPLLAALEVEAKGILALTLPAPRRPTPPPPPPLPPPPPRGSSTDSAVKSAAASRETTFKPASPFPAEDRVAATPTGAAPATSATTVTTATTATTPAVVSPSLLPVELFLALLGAGYVRGRLPYALADVVIDMLDERSYPVGPGRDALTSSPSAVKPTHGVYGDAGRPVEESSCSGPQPRCQPPGLGSGPDGSNANVGRLTAGQIEALLLAGPAIALIDHGATGSRRDAAASHGSSTQGYRLLTEFAEMLVKRGATIVRQHDMLAPPSAAAEVIVYEHGAGTLPAGDRSNNNGCSSSSSSNSSSSSSVSDGSEVILVSRRALCCLLHALSKRHRDGVFVPYSTWLYGKLYGQLVAEARAEAQMHAVAGSNIAAPDGNAAAAVDFGGDSVFTAAAAAAAIPSADADTTEVLAAVELLRLAACGDNRGDVALASLATQRLGTLLHRVAACGDAQRCGRLVAALDDVVWEEEALFGMSTAAMSTAAPPPLPPRYERAMAGLLPPVRKARRHVNAAAAAAATSTDIRPMLYGVGCAPAKDVVSVLVGSSGDPSAGSSGSSGSGSNLGEVVSELVYLAARELPCSRLAAVLSWASTGPMAAAEAVKVAADMKGTVVAAAASSTGVMYHGLSRKRLAAVWHVVVDRWLAPGGAWAKGTWDNSVAGAVPCVVPPVVGHDVTGKCGDVEATASDVELKQELVSEQETMDARAAAALLVSGERLGCTDPRAAQALSRVVEAALLQAECAEANDDEALLL
ncbi:hypothetical protein Vretifemale_12274, partial [Volvox reticuliferus]